MATKALKGNLFRPAKLCQGVCVCRFYKNGSIMVVGDESQSVFVCSWCTHAYCAGPGCVDVFVPRTCISNAKLKTDCVSTAKKNAVISASNVRTKVSRKDLNCIHR